jgi:hypothetical protein
MAPSADRNAAATSATTAAAPEASAPPGRFRRLLRRTMFSRHRWRTEHDLAQAVYGAVIGAAAIAVASGHGDLLEIVVTVLVTVLVYWAAERYAEVLAAAVHASGRRERVLAALRQGLPVVESALTPLAALLLVVLVTGQLRFAVFTALGLATLMLGGVGHAAARRAGASRLGAIGWGLGSAALGGLVIGLKMLLH